METNESINGYKAGFVAVMGRPNVGKSMLVNALLGQKVAAVTPRPQTTRRRQLGILTRDQAQIVFVDTPGVHKARHKLGEYMNIAAGEALQDADLILFVADGSLPPNDEDRSLAGLVITATHKIPTLLVVNKLDLVDLQQREEMQAQFSCLLPDAPLLWVSALRGDGLDDLLTAIKGHLSSGEPFFPADQVTDLYLRDLVADLIREAALFRLRDEVPHGIAVRIDQFIERGETGAHIDATIFVEKESHKGIVIGQRGEMLKSIGIAARKEIETLSGLSVYLQLRVKVNKNWRDDERMSRGETRAK